jgi:DNA-binding transcriptional regulator YhcF (GntR family)
LPVLQIADTHTNRLNSQYACLARSAGRAPPAPPPEAAAAPRPRPAAGGAIALVQSSSLPMLVQKELERLILAAELPAGSKLNEAAIAARLGVSRGPVREAFRALQESGLVRLEKNRGVFVRQIPVEEADEIYELRAVLDEPSAVVSPGGPPTWSMN